MIELCRLADGSISVRFDSMEVYILPPKNDCSINDLQSAFEAVVDAYGTKAENEAEKEARDDQW